MNCWDINKLLPLLKKCGDIALKHYGNPTLEIKSDNTVVTLADKEIEQLLALEFDRPEESLYLLGEETIKSRDKEYLKNALHQTCWIVDPIDGTAPYSIHLPVWGISIAYMKNGIISEGALYSPATGELTITSGNTVFTAKDSLIASDLIPFHGVRKLADKHGIIGISQHTAKKAIINLTNQVFAWSGCVASFQHLISGKLLGYIVGAKLWDIAGALPIMEKLGFCIIGNNGKDITTNIKDGSFNLELNSDQCWNLNGYAIAASELSVIEYINNNLELKI